MSMFEDWLKKYIIIIIHDKNIGQEHYLLEMIINHDSKKYLTVNQKNAISHWL